MSIRAACPSCRHPGFDPFYAIESVPALTTAVFASEEDARSVPAGDIVLALCGSCGFVGNIAFDARLADVERIPGGYEDQQGFSPAYSKFAHGLARNLIDRYDLRGKRVVEIGCGKGDFLSLLCEMGDNEGVGIDPIGRADRVPEAFRNRVAIVPECYAARHAQYRPDLIVCRHTLEHIHEPGDFLATIVETLAENRDAGVVFEVPDAVRVFDEVAFWDVYYEHCAYFTPGSLARAFRIAGFDVVDVRREYEGQYLVIHARVGRGGGAPLGVEESTAEVQNLATRFAASGAAAIDSWRKRIDGHAGRPPVLWGSGSKCVAFVSTLGIGEAIGGVVDINPYRQRRYVPGLRRPVMAPQDLRDERPDLIVLMNPVYLEEVGEMVRAMGVDAEIVAV